MERQVFRKHLRNVFPRAGEETRCGGNSAWRTWMEPSCPCSCVLFGFSPFPYIPQLLFQLEFPAAPAVAPSQPHPDEGSNKSLQMWAEHFHPQEELIKYTGNVFAFIWQLFRATTRFYGEEQRFAQVSDLSQSSVKSREHPPCSRNRYWTKAPGIFSAVPRKSICCRCANFLLPSSAELHPPKVVPIQIIPQISGVLSLFNDIHFSRWFIRWVCSEYLFLAGHFPLGRSWSWHEISEGTLSSSYPNDHVLHSLLLKCQLTSSQDCLATH